MISSKDNTPVALITGAAKRIGRAIAIALHREGYRVLIHYRHAESEASELMQTLNGIRSESAMLMHHDLNELDGIADCLTKRLADWGRLDVLIHNASEYFPTPLGDSTPAEWHRLMNSNCASAYFLTQAAIPYLEKAKGTVIYISDNQLPLKNYPIYSIAKLALNALTHTLAAELNPLVRVNAIALEKTLWATGPAAPTEQQKILFLEQKALISLDRVTETVLSLCQDHTTTGSIIALKNGRVKK